MSARNFTRRAVLQETLFPGEVVTSTSIPLKDVAGARIGIYGRFDTTSQPTITPVSTTVAHYTNDKFEVLVRNNMHGDISREVYTFIDTTQTNSIVLSGSPTKKIIAKAIADKINAVQGSFLTARNTRTVWDTNNRSITEDLEYVTLHARSGDASAFIDITDGTAGDTSTDALEFTVTSPRQSWLGLLVSSTWKGTFFPYTSLRWEFDGNGSVGSVLPENFPFPYIQFQVTNNDTISRQLELYISYEE